MLTPDAKPMNKIAHILPRQGSQSVGMGYELYRSSPRAREVFEEVAAALFELSFCIGPLQLIIEVILQIQYLKKALSKDICLLR